MRRSAVLAVCGFGAGIVVGGGLTIASRYALGAHAGVTPWLQAIANIALVIAALFAGWAALIARSSYRSQRSTAQRQLELANDEAARLIAADESRRHHASIDLLWRFIGARLKQQTWDGAASTTHIGSRRLQIGHDVW